MLLPDDNRYLPGSFMVPLLSGRFPTHLLSAEDPIRFLLDRAMEKHPSYRPLEGTSVVSEARFRLGCMVKVNYITRGCVFGFEARYAKHL